MATRLIAAFLVTVALVLAAAPTAAAEPDPAPPADEGGGVCQTVGDAAGHFLGGIPGVGALVDGAATAMCESGGNPAVAAQKAVTGEFADAWKDQFGKIVHSLLDGMAQVVVMSMTWWMRLPNPDLQNMTALQTISDYTFQIQLLLLTASIVVVAARVAHARHHARAEAAEESFRILFRTVFAASLAATVIAVATRAGDGFANWVVNATAHDDPIGLAKNMLSMSTYGAVSPGLMLIIGIVGILGALAQAVLLVIRQAMLIVAVAVLPVAAAAGGTQVGRQSYHKLTAWIIAFLLFKPVAALAYGIAFLAASSGSLNPALDQGTSEAADFQQALLGMVLLVCTAAVLPALMRLITPAVSAVGSGGSGAAATAGALMAGATIATGGKSLAAGKATGGAGAFAGSAPAGAAIGGGGQVGGGSLGMPAGSGVTSRSHSAAAKSAAGPRGSIAAGSNRHTPNTGRAASRPDAGVRAKAPAGSPTRAAAAGLASAGQVIAETTGEPAPTRTNPDMGRHTIRP